MTTQRARVAEEFAGEFAGEFALALHEATVEQTVEQTVEKVVESTLKAIGCDWAGVIYQGGDHQFETAGTDSVVADLIAMQVETGDGPDVPVLDDRLGVIITDTRAETRWPTWAAHAADVGIRSVLSARMSTDEEAIGTLSAYSRHPDAFDVDDWTVAQLLALHATVALDNARKIERLWLAVDARKQIGLAQGILMERFDLTGDRAFAVLLHYSQDHNVNLRTVADRLVETRQMPISQPPEPAARRVNGSRRRVE